MRHFSIIATLSFSLLSSAVYADAIPFISATDIDITRFIPKPPKNDSPQTLAEIKEVLKYQETRTPQMVIEAKADAQEDVWRFTNVMGPAFTAQNLPLCSAFFERIAETEGAVVDPAKKVFGRPRPPFLSDEVKPIVELSKSGAWPSGHSTMGFLMATVLADMVPEKRDAVFERAAQYAENRIVGGVHYRSDTQMGRVVAALIAEKIMERDDYKALYAPAKAELRKALGL